MAKKKQVKAEDELVRQREDRLDNTLFECLEIIKKPEKWVIDRQGNMYIVYPHPIVSREAHRIEGIQYLPHKSYYLPDVLLERQMYWEDLFKATAKVKAKAKADRKSYVRVTPEMIAEMLDLREQGLPVLQISKKVGVSEYAVRRYIKLYQEQTEAVAN